MDPPRDEESRGRKVNGERRSSTAKPKTTPTLRKRENLQLKKKTSLLRHRKKIHAEAMTRLAKKGIKGGDKKGFQAFVGEESPPSVSVNGKILQFSSLKNNPHSKKKKKLFTERIMELLRSRPTTQKNTTGKKIPGNQTIEVIRLMERKKRITRKKDKGSKLSDHLISSSSQHREAKRTYDHGKGRRFLFPTSRNNDYY